MRLAHLCPQLPSLENKQGQQGLIPELFPKKALVILSDMNSVWKCMHFNRFIKKQHLFVNNAMKRQNYFSISRESGLYVGQLLCLSNQERWNRWCVRQLEDFA